MYAKKVQRNYITASIKPHVTYQTLRTDKICRI